MIYKTTLSVDQNIASNDPLLVNNHLENIWNKVAWRNLRHYPSIFLYKLKTNLSHDSQAPGTHLEEEALKMKRSAYQSGTINFLLTNLVLSVMSTEQ